MNDIGLTVMACVILSVIESDMLLDVLGFGSNK